MSRSLPGRSVTPAPWQAGQRIAQRHGAEALSDLRVRLARRDGVAATIFQAVTTGECDLTRTYWMVRWFQPTFHVELVTAAHEPIKTELLLHDAPRAEAPGRGTSELAIATSSDGKVTTNLDSLAVWLGLGEGDIR